MVLFIKEIDIYNIDRRCQNNVKNVERLHERLCVKFYEFLTYNQFVLSLKPKKFNILSKSKHALPKQTKIDPAYLKRPDQF